MAFNARTILLIIAIVCFLLAAIGIPANRINLIGLGLFFWALTDLVP